MNGTAKHQRIKRQTRTQETKQASCLLLTKCMHYIDKGLISILSELAQIFYGLQIKSISKTHNSELCLDKNEFGNFVADEMHKQLAQYYSDDDDLFCVVGISYNIGIYSNKNRVVHGDSNEATQTSVCSFSKLGIYQTKGTRKLPNIVTQLLK
eukprot:7143_1